MFFGTYPKFKHPKETNNDLIYYSTNKNKTFKSVVDAERAVKASVSEDMEVFDYFFPCFFFFFGQVFLFESTRQFIHVVREIRVKKKKERKK